jgi:hypothetical protein
LSFIDTCGQNEISLGNPPGDGINVHALPKAQPFLDTFAACRAANYPFPRAFDYGPGKNYRCEGGKCRADSESCLPPFPDAGDAGDGSQPMPDAASD